MVKKYFAIFIVCIMAVMSCRCLEAAQEKQLIASVPKTSITTNESLILTVKAQGLRPDNPPETPQIDGFKVMSRGQQIEGARHVSIWVNGKQQVMNEEGSVVYSYELIPEKTGSFTIPSMSVVADRNRYRTQPIRLTVSKAAPVDERDVNISVSLSKTSCYIEEPVVLEIKMRFSKQLDSYGLNIPFLPGLKNVIIKDIEDTDSSSRYARLQFNGGQGVEVFKVQKELYNGVQYDVLTLQKILIPGSSGTINFDQVILNCDIVKGYQQGRSALDDFGFRGMLSTRRPIIERRVVRSEPLTLEVRPLPPAPSDVTGKVSVGVYTMRVDASPRTVKEGEPITVKVTIAGAGNIEALTEPELSDDTNFRKFTEDAKTEVAVSIHGVTGSKTFESVLIPTTHRVNRIPPFSFSYFDPSSGNFNTLRSDPVSITVNPAPDQQQPVIIGGDEESSGKKEVKIIYRDLPGHIMYSTSTMVTDGDYVYSSWWYRLLLVLPVMGNIVLLFFLKRRRRLNEDNAFRRKVHARRKAVSILKTAKKSLHKNHTVDFYSHLVHALNEYIGGKLNIPAAGLTAHSVKTLFEEKQLDPQLTSRVVDLYESADMARFVPDAIGSKTKPHDDLNEANDLLAQLEKIKW